MKIAMFSWEALHGWAAALQRRGHEVHVFTRPGYGTGYARKICRRGTDILNHDI